MPGKVPPPRKPGDGVPFSQPPSDVTIGELWRIIQAMSTEVAKLNDMVTRLPDRVAGDLDGRLNATRQEFAHIDLRLFAVEKWEAETVPQLALLVDRVALLQRLVYGATGTTLLAVLVAALSVVVTRH